MENRLSYPKSQSFTSLTMMTLILSVLTLAGGSFFYLQKSSTLNHLRPIGLGLNTCFFRLNQTFTARMINEKSAKYLGADFISDTENCLADLATLEADQDSKIGQKINHLSSVAHQFHSSLEMAKSVFTRNSEDGIGPLSYYKKLESTKFEIENQIEKNAQGSEKILSKLQWALVANILILIFLAFKASQGVFQLENTNAKNAKKEQDISTTAKNVQTLIHDHNILPAIDKAELKKLDSTQANALSWVKNTSEEAKEEAIEKSWQLSEKLDDVLKEEAPLSPAKKTPQFVQLETLNNAESILLEDIISKSLERISAKVFSDGITIDLNLKDNVQIDIKNEELTDQVIYQTLSSLLAGNYHCQSLAIFLGHNSESQDIAKNNYHLEISAIYSPDNNLFAGSTTSSKGLEIAKALGEEGNIKIEVKNMTSSEGQIIGQKVTLLYFEEVVQKAVGPKLVQVRKSTKKQLKLELEV